MVGSYRRTITAEQAYGVGDFRTAQSITVDVNQLDGTAERADRDALPSAPSWPCWGIHLYGLNEPDQAHGFYELVLASNPRAP